AIHTAVALGQLGLGLVGHLRHSGTPCLTCALLETRSTCLFPSDLFYCYHDTDLHSDWKVVVLAVGKFAPSQRPLSFQHDSALCCARPSGVLALFTVPISTVLVVVSCPPPSLCSKQKYTPMHTEIQGESMHCCRENCYLVY